MVAAGEFLGCIELGKEVARLVKASSFITDLNCGDSDDWMVCLDGDLVKTLIWLVMTFPAAEIKSGENDDEMGWLYDKVCKTFTRLVLPSSSRDDFICRDIAGGVNCPKGELSKATIRLLVASFFRDDLNCREIVDDAGFLNGKGTKDLFSEVAAPSLITDLKCADIAEYSGCLDGEIDKVSIRLDTDSF